MHHSSDFDPEMSGKILDQADKETSKQSPLIAAEVKAVEAARLVEGEEQPGPTGKIPDGKLTEMDLGETAFRIATVEDKIILDFGKPTSWVGMSADQAFGLAKILYKRAKKLQRQKLIITPGGSQ